MRAKSPRQPNLPPDIIEQVEIMMALEEKFGVLIGESGAENISTVQDAADLIEKAKTADAEQIGVSVLVIARKQIGVQVASRGDLISSFNHRLHMAAPYLIASVVLILCICCFIWFSSCLVSIFSCLFTCISSTVRFLFLCISSRTSTVKGCFSAVCYIVSCFKQCLCFGGELTVKTMKAPGMAGVMIVRSVFEASPQAYFTGLQLLF